MKSLKTRVTATAVAIAGAGAVTVAMAGAAHAAPVTNSLKVTPAGLYGVGCTYTVSAGVNNPPSAHPVHFLAKNGTAAEEPIGTVDSGDSLSPSVSWTPSAAGVYTVSVEQQGSYDDTTVTVVPGVPCSSGGGTGGGNGSLGSLFGSS